MHESSRRRAELLAGISARLRPICAALLADEFDTMVNEIARVTLKYEGRVTPTEFELEMMRRRAAVERAILRTAAPTHSVATRP